MIRFREIDDDGNVIQVECRKEGLWYKPVPVQGSDGKWGYTLVKMYYDELKEFQSWIIQPKYDKAWPFDPDLLIAQVKVDEEKSYIEYDSVNDDVILREELGPDEKKYPAYPYRDHATYSGPNFIKITPSAQAYLDTVSKKAGDFYQIFEDAWFDYNDVSEILAKEKSKFTHDYIPNWGMTRYKTMNEIIAETEVWLITDDDAKRGVSIEVKNRFTGKKERLTIPEYLGSGPVNEKDQERSGLIEQMQSLLRRRDDLKKQPNEQLSKAIEEELRELYKRLWGEDERTHMDWMGCYIPRTGTILIKIDSVDEEARLFGCSRCFQDLLFQKVLLHEFIHAALDLWPRDAAGKISYPNGSKWQKNNFNEESIDNAIVLKLYKGTPGYRDVKGFIETQPYYYRRAVELYESGNLLDQLIEELIAYKISAPVSTTLSTAKGGKYTYYVNDKLIVPVGKMGAGIGAAAYEVFKTIISTLSLDDALKKFEGLKLGSLPIVIDANAYKNSPNQNRYYTVPVRTKDGQDIYLCSQWIDTYFDRLEDVVSDYPDLFSGIYRK